MIVAFSFSFVVGCVVGQIAAVLPELLLKFTGRIRAGSGGVQPLRTKAAS